MQTLFAPETSNFCQSLLLRDFSEWTKISGHLNRDSLLKGWEPLEFFFQASDKGADTKPDICPVYISGAIAFRGDLKQKIFPSPCCEVEFLPIRVSGEEWMLLNCLKTTRQYDSQKSQLHRIGNGDIFIIQRLVVNDPSLQRCEVFTLEDSNRAQLIALPSFHHRIIKELNLQGLNFKEIGYNTAGK